MKIKRVWADYDIKQGGELGMRIHVRFSSSGGEPLHIAAFFNERDGRSVRPSLSYRNNIDYLFVGEAQFKDETFGHKQLFLPYSALPQDEAGTHEYKFYVEARSLISNEILASSGPQHFQHTVFKPQHFQDTIWPSAEIKRVWTEHNVLINGRQNMLIHTDFNTRHLKDEKVEVIAFFRHHDGSERQVKTSASGYQAQSGQLCVYKEEVSPYEITNFNDMKLSLPYSALPQDELGTHNYKFDVHVRSFASGRTLLASSEPQYFDYTVSPSADIKKVWTDHNTVINSRQGMLIHTNFEMNHLKGEQLEVIAFFYRDDAASSPIRAESSANVDFKTVSGELCVWGRCVPRYDLAVHDDYKLFLPTETILNEYKTGQPLKFKVYVRSGEPNLQMQNLAESQWQQFNFL